MVPEQDLRKLHSAWKKKLSCGGEFILKTPEQATTAASASALCFQGDHSRELYKWIMALGYSKDRILIAGTGK
jgi:translation initiation factor 1 (eIF-1/SUI1)